MDHHQLQAQRQLPLHTFKTIEANATSNFQTVFGINVKSIAVTAPQISAHRTAINTGGTCRKEI